MFNVEKREVLNPNLGSIYDDEIVGTGYKVVEKGQNVTPIDEEGEIDESQYAQVLLYGDTNGDGKIDSLDIGPMVGYINGKVALEGIQKIAANVVNNKEEAKEIGTLGNANNTNGTNDTNNVTVTNKKEQINEKDVARIKEFILKRLNTRIVEEMPEESEINNINSNELEEQEISLKLTAGEKIALNGKGSILEDVILSQNVSGNVNSANGTNEANNISNNNRRRS